MRWRRKSSSRCWKKLRDLTQNANVASLGIEGTSLRSLAAGGGLRLLRAQCFGGKVHAHYVFKLRRGLRWIWRATPNRFRPIWIGVSTRPQGIPHQPKIALSSGQLALQAAATAGNL